MTLKGYLWTNSINGMCKAGALSSLFSSSYSFSSIFLYQNYNLISHYARIMNMEMFLMSLNVYCVFFFAAFSASGTSTHLRIGRSECSKETKAFCWSRHHFFGCCWYCTQYWNGEVGKWKAIKFIKRRVFSSTSLLITFLNIKSQSMFGSHIHSLFIF